MRISHIALWTNQLDHMKEFYCKYFEGVAGEKYRNELKGFESYFIAFDQCTKLELMHMPDIVEQEAFQMISCMGLAHFAISVGSEIEVKRLTQQLRIDGYTIAGEPRFTGDGYFESIILDPDGNAIEITA